jgi:hypothetical protein
MRNLSEVTKNLTGQRGNRDENYLFNYDSGTPHETMRNLSENTKNLTGTKGIYSNKEYLFNYEAGIPQNTNRNQTGSQKNISGFIGDCVQSRSRLDFNNALLNTEKEVVAEGRDPVPVKDNIGPITMFTEYVFCDDTPLQKNTYSNTKPFINLENDLYKFT